MPAATHSARRPLACAALGSLLGLAVAAGTAVALPSTASADSGERPAATSWIANSGHGGGLDDPTSAWVQQDALGAAVDADGTAYVVTDWDEGTAEVGVYRAGRIVGRVHDTHGWGRMGGSAVALDAHYLYQAMAQSPQGGIDSPASGTWYGYRRFDKASLTDAPLPGGRSRNGSMRVVSTTAAVTGLASTGGLVYAAVAGEDRVHVFRADDASELSGIAVPSPRSLAVDAAGDLWAVSGSGPDLAVREYAPTGALLQTVTHAPAPTSVALDPQGHLLVTSDDPATQQVLVLDPARPGVPQLDAVGVPGGMFAAPRGAVGPMRFNGLVGAGVAGDGSMVTVEGLGGDGTVVRGESRARGSWQEQWRLTGLAFTDNADLDPADDSIAYTARDAFSLDRSKPAGQQWTWTAHTVDRFAVPDDGRLQATHQESHQYTTPHVVHLQGRTFLFLTGMYQDSPGFWRLDGQVAVPSTVFPTFKGWGWQVDDRGDVWNVDGGHGLRYRRFLGLSAAGDPQYADPVELPCPPGMTFLTRVHYDPAADVMVLGGWTAATPLPQDAEVQKLAGGEVWRIDGWFTGNRTPRWRTVLPYSRPGSDLRDLDVQMGLSVAGDRWFTVEMGTSRVRAWSSTTGAQLGSWAPGPEVGAYTGVVDVPDGVRAEQRRDGGWTVFVEDDHAAKVLMYDLAPDATTPAAPAAPSPTESTGALVPGPAAAPVGPGQVPVDGPVIGPVLGPVLGPVAPAATPATSPAATRPMPAAAKPASKPTPKKPAYKPIARKPAPKPASAAAARRVAAARRAPAARAAALRAARAQALARAS